MNFDLHGVLTRKQERECAKTDDFAFKARARSLSLFGERLRQQDIDVHPRALAERIAVETDEAIFEMLLGLHAGDRHAWARAFARSQAQAASQLRAELGDPTPHRLA